MSKSINSKLKASVKASLDKAKKTKRSKKTEELSDARLDDKTRDYLGIPKATERPKEWYVFMVKYHNRARLDHVKYPNERCHKLPNSPMFATHEEVDRYCRKMEKEDKENLYFSHPTWIPEPEIPKDVMKKIIKRGW